MGMVPVLRWRLFPSDAQDHVLSQNMLLRAYEGLCQANQDYLKAHPETPLLYSARAGVRYFREPPGKEEWCDIPTVLFDPRKHDRGVDGTPAKKEDHWGDCEDLGGWLVAELRQKFKIPARPFLKFRRVRGAYHYHALVVLPARWVWDYRVVRDGKSQMAVIGPKGQPLIERYRKPLYTKRDGSFVFEDPSLRLGMRDGKRHVKGAYRSIIKRGQDPLKVRAALLARKGLL